MGNVHPLTPRFVSFLAYLPLHFLIVGCNEDNRLSPTAPAEGVLEGEGVGGNPSSGLEISGFDSELGPVGMFVDDDHRPRAGAPIVDSFVFVSDRDGNREIYTVNIDGTGLTRLTYDASVDELPEWSPDGQHIAFQSNRTGSFEIYVMKPDGSSVIRRTFSSSNSGHPTWSPDGNEIAYSSGNIWRVGAFSGSPSLLFAAPGIEEHPDWSPDGARLALSSDWYAYDFVRDIFLVNVDGSGFTGLTDNIFDHVDYTEPAWSPNGLQLSVLIDDANPDPMYPGIAQLGVMNQDGTNLRPIALAENHTRSSWSPNGKRIVYTSENGDLLWIKPDGTARGTIIQNAWNADWRP